MIDKNLIKKMVDHTLRPEKKQFIDNNIMHPEREWLIGILVGVVIFVSGLVWGLHTYNFYRNIEIVTYESEAVVYRASLVEETLRDFAKREEIYNELLTKNKTVEAVVFEEDVIQATSSTSTTEIERSMEMIESES